LVLDAVSAEVRTGSSLTLAVHRALVRYQPHGQAIAPSATLAAMMAVPVVDPDEAVVVQAISAAHALGGPVAATLDSAAALLRERTAIRGEALAHSAQARLSARVLTGVPLAFAGWSLVSSKSFRTAVLSTVGLASALIGAVCNLIGWWWMRRIVGKAIG
jgi:Flp pilus assembly protein TadB